MKIAVLGCGAIGGLILGYLSKQGKDVLGIVRDYQKEPLEKENLIIEGLRGNDSVKVKVCTELEQRVDLAVFATKINGLEDIVKRNLDYLRDCLVLTTQNGIRAEHIMRDYFPKDKIVTGIVMFGATFYPPNRIVHNFGDALVLGNMFAVCPDIDKVRNVFSDSFNATYVENIKGAKYLKIFINLNNCIPALLGVSMQEAFGDIEVAELAIRLNREAYSIVQKSKIILESLPSYPKERLEGLVCGDLKESAVIFSKIMVSLSKVPLYGSILQSIRRKKKSEIDYINGEIVKLARENGLESPLNRKIVEAVREIEQGGGFLNKGELFKKMGLK